MAQLTTQQAFDLAMQHLQAGRLLEAEPLFLKVLSQSPEDVDALRCLGVIAFQKQQSADAIDFMRRALALEPDYAEAHNDLGIFLKSAGQFHAAIQAFREAIALVPDYPEALGNLAITLTRAGLFNEAIAAFEQLLILRPDDAIIHYNLGNALKDAGKLDEAIAAWSHAILLNPAFPGAHNNLGSAQMQREHFDAAINSFSNAIALNPGDAEAHNNLGKAQNAKGHLAEAMAAFRQAVSLNPNSSDAYSNLGTVLKGLGQIDDAVAAFRKAGSLDPTNVKVDDDLVYALHFHPASDASAIAQEHRAWNHRRAQTLAKFVQPHCNDSTADRRLRIGYVSPDFRSHVVGRNLLPLLREHDRRGFEIFCYSQVIRRDPMTDDFQRLADGWCNSVDLSNDQLAEQVRRDRIDILVDLTLHMVNNRLLVFARKPAPVQITFAGYPGSTGLSAIDYRLSDPYLDPPGMDESVYSERTVRLPDSFWCYDPLDCSDIPVNPLPAPSNGFVTFGSLNTFCKVNDDVLALWIKVLRQVENSRLLLMAPMGSHRSRLLERFGKEGIDQDRIEFVGLQSRRIYLETYHRIDLGLDTFPYNGHTTSLDSFWMGVPVVTLVGQTSVSRAGWCQLSNLGLQELAAHTPDEFIRIATSLAGDLPRLTALRSTLRQRMEHSPLMDAPKFARNVEAAYRQMWRSWCEFTSVGNE